MISWKNFSLIFLDEKMASVAGAAATLTAPSPLSGTTFSSVAPSRPAEWVFGFGPVTSVAHPPAGTYVASVAGYGTLTFKNFQPAAISTIGSSESLVYPVLKVTTNEAGEISKIDYKWKIVQSGTARNATAAEVAANVEDTQKITTKGFIHGSPFIGFNFKSDSKGTTPIMFDRDAGSTTITTVPIDGGGTRKVLLSDVSQITITYNMTTRAVHRFYFK